MLSLGLLACAGRPGEEGYPSFIFPPLPLKSEKAKVPLFAIVLCMISIFVLSKYWLLRSEGLADGAGGCGRWWLSCVVISNPVRDSPPVRYVYTAIEISILFIWIWVKGQQAVLQS